MTKEMLDNIKAIVIASIIVIICMIMPKFISPDLLKPIVKTITLIAGCASAGFWYRAAITPIPEFPVGFDLNEESPNVKEFLKSLKISANLNRVAAAFTAVAAAGAACDWYLEKFF